MKKSIALQSSIPTGKPSKKILTFVKHPGDVCLMVLVQDQIKSLICSLIYYEQMPLLMVYEPQSLDNDS